MKIKKIGNLFVAFRDENDIDSVGTGMNSQIKVGDSLGRINIENGKFTGNTVCLPLLSQHLNEYLESKEKKYEELIDEVIEEIKSDINSGDLTVLDGLLREIPTRHLIESLAEERWKDFEGI